MENMDLLVCMIETEINKLKYLKGKAFSNVQKTKFEELKNQIAGLEKSLQFIREIQ